MKELKVISLENGVILSENLVKGSILPRTSAELERDVLIQNDTIVEGAIYARKLKYRMEMWKYLVRCSLSLNSISAIMRKGTLSCVRR